MSTPGSSRTRQTPTPSDTESSVTANRLHIKPSPSGGPGTLFETGSLAWPVDHVTVCPCKCPWAWENPGSWPPHKIRPRRGLPRPRLCRARTGNTRPFPAHALQPCESTAAAVPANDQEVAPPEMRRSTANDSHVTGMRLDEHSSNEGFVEHKKTGGFMEVQGRPGVLTMWLRVSAAGKAPCGWWLRLRQLRGADDQVPGSRGFRRAGPRQTVGPIICRRSRCETSV